MNAESVIQTRMETSLAQLLAVKNFSHFLIHKEMLSVRRHYKKNLEIFGNVLR